MNPAPGVAILRFAGPLAADEVAPAPDSPVDRSACPGASMGTAHGTASAAAHGCICPDARAARAAYARELRRRSTGAGHARTRHRPALPAPVRRPPGPEPTRTHAGPGAQRRLRALTVAGHRRRELAALLHCCPEQVSMLLWYADRGERIQPADHDAVAFLFLELAHQPGSGLAGAGRVLNDTRKVVAVARRNGWHPAADWAGIDIDDPAARPRTAARIPLDDTPPAERARLGPDHPRWEAIRSPGVAARGGVPLVRVDTPSPTRGRGTHAATLTDQDVWAVRDHWVADVGTGRLTLEQLAAGYGVTTRTVLDIVAGLARPHLQLPALPRPLPGLRPSSTLPAHPPTPNPIPASPGGPARPAGRTSGGPRMLPSQPAMRGSR